MASNVLRKSTLRALIMAYVLLAGGLIVLVQAQTVAAQGGRTEIVIGLQNDMTTMNYWNPETNTVWNYYQTGLLTFEGLYASTPDNVVFSVLSDPARGTSGPGFTVVQTTPHTIIDVFVRAGVTFHDGSPMTADDVVFSYQTKAWSTEQTAITEALWWDAPLWPHWSGGGNDSHIGVEKVSDTQVRFHLVKEYALFFLQTLQVTVIPKAIWVTHMDPDPPLNISDPRSPITDSSDGSIDFAYGSSASQTAATIGTGFFEFLSWQPNQGSRLSTYDGYWGKAESVTWRGTAYPFFPEHLRSIRFVIYTSLDVISLALQKGDIDTLIWSLTPGFLSQVRSNPAISVEQVTDAGYFYMSFNLRRKPWSDLDLRRAISMAINKDYIVNTLMGGFGTKGNQPISIHTAGYVNASAVQPDFDIPGAIALLNANGIVDQNGDGFREYSDGSPIRATILTPPKDYDPVRADAGIMISNNLKSIGLNIDAAPTSFDTIVAKAFTEVDFDIYILGWLLTGTPETYLGDFFHSSNDVAVNPAGSNSAGYNNPEVDALLEAMTTELDNDARIQIVKDVQGIVASEIPWNILYYRKNLNAYRNDAWVGWVNTPPQLYNFWSLVKIRPAGVTPVPPPTGEFTVAMTVAERAIAGHTEPVDVFVSLNLRPVDAATVVLNATWGAEYRTVSATTDASGHARIDWVSPVIQGQLTLRAIVTKGTQSATVTKRLDITVGPPAPMASLSLSTTTPVIGTGDTATIVARLVNGLGNPIQGRTVTIDTTLVLGDIVPASAATDAAGQASFVYTAPADASLFPNQHLSEIVKATTNVPETVAVDTQRASLVLFVENDDPSDWRIVSVDGTPDLVLSSAPPGGDSTTIDVRVRDFAGAALAGVEVEAILPADNWNVTVTPAVDTTDATGLAQFTVSVTASADADLNSTNIPLRFRAVNDPAAVSDEVQLFLGNLVSTGFAAWLSFSDRGLTGIPAQTATATLTVYDELGLPAAGVPAILAIPYGDLGLPAHFPYSYDYDTPEYQGDGLDLNMFGQGSIGGSLASSAGQGTAWGVENFVEDFEVVGNHGALTGVYIDSCDGTGESFGTDPWPADFDGLYYMNVTSVTDSNGQLVLDFSTLPHRIDSGIQVRAFVGDPLAADPLQVVGDACNYAASIENREFMIDSGVVVSRAPVVAMGTWSMDQPVLTSQDRTASLSGTFYRRGGLRAANFEVFLLRGFGAAGRNIRGAFGGTIAADANGVVTWTVAEQSLAAPPLSLSQPIFFTFVPGDARYAYGGREQLFSGSTSTLPTGFAYGDFWFAPTFAVMIAKIPFDLTVGYLYVPSSVAFASVSVDRTIVAEGGTVIATVTVEDGDGNPIPNATVWSGAYQLLTDANGEAQITYTAGSGAIENLAVITTPDGQVLRAWYGVLATAPVLSYASLAVTEQPAGQATEITVSVTNTLAVAGTTTVVLLVNGQAVAAQQITIGASATQTVRFRHVFDQAGDYQVAVGSQSATATVPAPTVVGADFVATYGLGLALLVVGLIVGVVIGMFLKGRGKKPSPMRELGEKMAPAEEELAPTEEELGP